MFDLVADDTGQLLGQLFAATGFEIVITGMGLWEAMGPAMTDLTLSASEIGKCEFLGAAGAAVFGDRGNRWNCQCRWFRSSLDGRKNRSHLFDHRGVCTSHAPPLVWVRQFLGAQYAAFM